MATYNKRADQCPAIVLPPTWFDPDVDLPVVSSTVVQWTLPPDIITGTRQMAGQTDMGMREGAPGGYGVCEGLDLYDVATAGIRVTAGVAAIDGPRVLKALGNGAFSWVPNPNTPGIAGLVPFGDNLDNYCWMLRDKSLVKATVASGAAAPAAPSTTCAYLGMVPIVAGAGTPDYSGRIFRQFGGPWERITADTGMPADAPPAALRFLQRSRTTNGDHLYWWDGSIYRYQQPTGVTTPAQWTADQNDYALPATTGALRPSTDASRNLTGIAGGVDGRLLRVVNVGMQNLVLKHQNAGSAAGNRFLSSTAADVTLGGGASVILAYDGTAARWRVQADAVPSGAAGGDLTGTYPNPTIAALAVTDAKVAAANKDGAAGTASMRTLGAGATQAAAGNDARFAGTAPNHQTGTSYTLVLTDAGLLIDCDNGAAFTLTIPANASVAFPIGTTILIFQGGAGQVTVGITTDTLRVPNGAKTPGQYRALTLWKRGSTEWVVMGDSTA